jgi:hypothetical protein
LRLQQPPLDIVVLGSSHFLRYFFLDALYMISLRYLVIEPHFLALLHLSRVPSEFDLLPGVLRGFVRELFDNVVDLRLFECNDIEVFGDHAEWCTFIVSFHQLIVLNVVLLAFLQPLLVLDVAFPVLLLDHMPQLVSFLLVVVDLVDHDNLLRHLLRLVQVHRLAELPRRRKPLAKILAMLKLLDTAVPKSK